MKLSESVFARLSLVQFRSKVEMLSHIKTGQKLALHRRRVFKCTVLALCPLQGNTIPGVLKFHGVITTFEMIMADCPELKKLHWRCVVIDEAHRLKNRNCKLLEGLKLMNLVSL